MKKWAEAVGLLDRALEHVIQSLEQYRSLEHGIASGGVKIDQEKVSVHQNHATLFFGVFCTILYGVVLCSPCVVQHSSSAAVERDHKGQKV